MKRLYLVLLLAIGFFQQNLFAPAPASLDSEVSNSSFDSPSFGPSEDGRISPLLGLSPSRLTSPRSRSRTPSAPRDSLDNLRERLQTIKSSLPARPDADFYSPSRLPLPPRGEPGSIDSEQLPDPSTLPDLRNYNLDPLCRVQPIENFVCRQCGNLYSKTPQNWSPESPNLCTQCLLNSLERRLFYHRFNQEGTSGRKAIKKKEEEQRAKIYNQFRASMPRSRLSGTAQRLKKPSVKQPVQQPSFWDRALGGLRELRNEMRPAGVPAI